MYRNRNTDHWLLYIGQKKASSHSLVITRDTRNRDRERSSGQSHLFNICATGAIDRTSGQPQVKLSLFARNIYFKKFVHSSRSPILFGFLTSEVFFDHFSSQKIFICFLSWCSGNGFWFAKSWSWHEDNMEKWTTFRIRMENVFSFQPYTFQWIGAVFLARDSLPDQSTRPSLNNFDEFNKVKRKRLYDLDLFYKRKTEDFYIIVVNCKYLLCDPAGHVI